MQDAAIHHVVNQAEVALVGFGSLRMEWTYGRY